MPVVPMLEMPGLKLLLALDKGVSSDVFLKG